MVQQKETELQVLNSKLNLLEKQYNNKIEYYEVEKNKSFKDDFFIVDSAFVRREGARDYRVDPPTEQYSKYRKRKDNVKFLTRSQWDKMNSGTYYAKDGQVRQNKASWYEIKEKLKKGDLWSWGWSPVTQEQINNTKSDITAKKSELNSAKATAITKREAYEIQAIQCGIDFDPFKRSRSSTSTLDLTSAPILRYFKHGQPKDLHHLTINDYTFITNRVINTSMSDVYNTRPNEAFISLKNLKYNANYQLYFNTVDDTVESEKITTATKLVVNKADWSNNDSTCSATDIQNFTVDNDAGTKTGLSFQLETRGQSVPKNDDPYDGYKCEYTTTVRLLNGGFGWKKGDKVNVTMSGVQYVITVKAISKRKELGNLGIVNYNTPVDGETIVDQGTILQQLAAGIEAATFGMQATIIGSGIHVQSPNEFQVTTNDTSLLNVMTDSVNDISKLPEQCRK